MSPIKDPERQREASRKCMSRLLRRRKLSEIFASIMEKFFITLETMQIDNTFKGKPQYFKLFIFEGMKFFLPVDPSSDIEEETLLRQKYKTLKWSYESQGIPFVKSFAEFKKRLHVYKKRYEIKCVD